MKTKSFLGMGVLLIAMCLGTTSCGKDDKKNEVLPDPMETTLEYYLVGIVSSADGVVKGAEVKISDAVTTTTDTEGKYSLMVDKTGDYTVAVKAGKMEDFSTKVTIASSAANRSTVTLNVKMSKVVEYTEPVTVKADEEVNVEVPSASESETGAPAVVVAVPAGAAGEGVTISAGAYEEAFSAVSTPPTASEENKEEATAISSISMKVEPADATALKPIVIATPNSSTNTTVYFDPSNMVAQKDGATTTRAWVDLGEVKFNNGSYELTIPVGGVIAGKYATRIKTEKVTSKEAVGEFNLSNGEETVKKDNSGNIAGIRDFEIKVAIKSGWEYSTTAAAALKNAGAEDAKLAAIIEKQIMSVEGSPLVYTTERKLKTNISGNSILYYQSKAKYCTKTYTFKIMVNGSKKDVKVVLKCYTGSEEKYTNQSSDNHSGGGTN